MCVLFPFVLDIKFVEYSPVIVNLNVCKPSEHLPNQVGELSKRLGGNIGCKNKNSSWDFTGLKFLNGGSIGSTA